MRWNEGKKKVKLIFLEKKKIRHSKNVFVTFKNIKINLIKYKTERKKKGKSNIPGIGNNLLCVT